MPRFDTVQVCVDVDGSGQTALMGELHYQQSGSGEIFSFEYDKHWLARPEVFAFDPDLALSAGHQYPAADRTNFGIFLDHATGLVVGETAVIEDDVSILQGVTLGGTGKETGDRHPKIRHGVLIGAGAKILGNIEIGYCARVAAGSVVLAAVPHNKTVAGVPARIVGEAGCAEPARDMNQILAEKALEA